MKKYFYLPGGLMVVGSITWAALTLRWDMPAVVLGAGGLLVLALALAANWREFREWTGDPRGIFAVNTAISTLLLVLVLAVVNAIVGLRAIRFDLTASGRNTLSQDTRHILATLGSDVELKEFGRNRDPAIESTLASLAAATPRVQVSFVDVERSVQEARTYGVVRNGTVVVQSGDKYRKVERVNEMSLAVAIVQVTSGDELRVCFVTGEGEHGLFDESATGVSGLAAVLRASNYKPDSVNLQQAPVPADCAVLILAGPRAPVPPEVIERIDAYLRAGGRVALAVDPLVDPSIAAWLKPHGISTGHGLILDSSPVGRSVGASPDSPLAVRYFSHPITRGFELAAIFGRAVPLDVDPNDAIGRPVPVAATSEESFERSDLMTQSAEFQSGRDRRGPFVVVAAADYPPGANDPPGRPLPRLVVVGDSDFLSNALIGRSGNRDLAMRIVAWLAGEEEARVVSVADAENRRVEMTERTRAIMYLVNIGLLPLVPLLLGLVRLFRSRR